MVKFDFVTGIPLAILMCSSFALGSDEILEGSPSELSLATQGNCGEALSHGEMGERFFLDFKDTLVQLGKEGFVKERRCEFDLTIKISEGFRARPKNMIVSFLEDIKPGGSFYLNAQYSYGGGRKNRDSRRQSTAGSEIFSASSFIVDGRLEDFSNCGGQIAIQGEVDFRVSGWSVDADGTNLILGNKGQPAIQWDFEYESCQEQTSPTVYWSWGENGSIPAQAASIGTRQVKENSFIEGFLCRSSDGGSVSIGHIWTDKGYCVFLENQVSKRATGYEVLSFDGDFDNYYFWQSFDFTPESLSLDRLREYTVGGHLDYIRVSAESVPSPGYNPRYETGYQHPSSHWPRSFNLADSEFNSNHQGDIIDMEDFLNEKGFLAGEGRFGGNEYICRVNKLGEISIGTVSRSGNSCLVDLYGIRAVTAFDVLVHR